MRGKVFLFTSLFIMGILLLFGVEVKKITVDNYQAFQRGSLQGTALDNTGTIFIGPEISRVNGPQQEFYLSMDISAKGVIYLGTGHSGSVFKLQPQAKGSKSFEEIFRSEQLDVNALLVQGDGTVLVGTSPNGKVYKISKDKKVVELFNPDEKFIWDLKRDKLGNVYCAVGNNGGVYKVYQTGDVRKIFTAEDTHIITLFITEGGAVLAGSGDRGVLYRIENQKIKVLYDSVLDEVRGICEDREGNIYFAVTRGIRKRETEKNLGFSSYFTTKKEKREPTPVERSILYRMTTNGIVEAIWSSKEEYAYSLVYDRSEDAVVLGTGNSGRVYRVKGDGRFALLYESDSAQIYKLQNYSAGILMMTNNTAGLITLKPQLNNRGTYFSEIFDLRIKSKLGKIYWESQTFQTNSVSLFVRTGNSILPDSTWAEWSPPFTDGENSLINVSGNRYFQFKIVMNTSNTGRSPTLSSCSVFYIESNLEPRLTLLEVDRSWEFKSRIKKKKAAPDDSKYLRVRWQAKDANRDRLLYKLWLRRVADKGWTLLEDNLTATEFKINSELFADGKYRFKVEVDDSPNNPPNMVKRNEKISSPVIIDSTAPLVRNLQVASGILKFTVTDRVSRIHKVMFSFDSKHWSPIFPVDLINDSKSEEYTLNLHSLKKGKMIFVKVVDEFRNAKVFQSVL